jgi:2-polyprenyl-6-methoxyphenol hydroxylase-like FAD-dependent oxidoreductase
MVGERIAVIGGGIAGLATALALKNSAREVIVIERDPEPPELRPEQAFERWQRPGVPQFRHAHMFLSRLQTIVRDVHPELLSELRAAGLELSTLDEVLPESHVGKLPPLPEDGDLLHLWGRRPTFEYVLRRHVGRLAHVRFVHSARVESLLAESDARHVHVRGVTLVREGRRDVVEADLVVDASGKRTHSPEWLAALGVKVDVSRRPTGRVYACRHYRLRDLEGAPRRTGTGANLDFFGYSTFYAEHGHYAITLSCPEQEQELAEMMSHAQGFEVICRRVPVLADWIDRSEPTSKVLGAARFENRWTRFGVAGGRALSGFVAVGDAHVETNPMYGRGCAAAFMQAHVLADVLARSGDRRACVRDYATRTRALLQPHFDFCVATDRMFHSRGKLARGERVPLLDSLVKLAFEQAWTPAMERSPTVAREMIKAMQMRDLSSVRLRLLVLAHVMAAAVAGLFRRRAAAPLPDRAELLRSLAAECEAAARDGASGVPDALHDDAQLDDRRLSTG